MREFLNKVPSYPFLDPKSTVLVTEQISDGNRIKGISKYVVADASTDMRSSVGMHDFSLENLQASGIDLRGSMTIGDASPDAAVNSILDAIELGADSNSDQNVESLNNSES